MPFKIKLRSKQQYNVSSKSTFVITVELLDNSTLECTLSGESTGRDCMDNVCQRLGLQQPDLFGLRYISRKSYPKIRWVDLDRPLKKQLNKYAQEPYLYLSVMFYVQDVSLLEDEVTRYHFFLQLKMDVIEGRLRCNYEQAIVLASYSLQAEFGDYDPERHTLEYLQDFALLPKPIMSQWPEERLGTLTDATISQYASLRGIAQQLAEVYYIVGAQQLDGYGQECFLAKDEMGNEVLIGASLTGIVVRKGNVLRPDFFKWSTITNLVNHKRYFGIECQNYQMSSQFLLDEADSAKYVWKMCVLQHTFYKMHANATENNELNICLENKTRQDVEPLESSNMKINDMRTPGTYSEAEIQNAYQQSQNIMQSVWLHSEGENQFAYTNNLQSSFNKYLLSHSPHFNSDLEKILNGQHVYTRNTSGFETAIRQKYEYSSDKGLVESFHPNRSNLNLQTLPENFVNSQRGVFLDSFIGQRGQVLPPLLSEERAYLFQNHQNDCVKHTYSSTPDLNRTNFTNKTHNDFGDFYRSHITLPGINVLNSHQRPPPPYPGPFTKTSSTSTPDLPGVIEYANNKTTIGGSSPDLISKRNLSGRDISRQPQKKDMNVFKTVDSLHSVAEFHENIIGNRNALSTEDLSRVKKSSITSTKTCSQSIYVSHKEPLYQNQQALNYTHSEPIYQNLPVHLTQDQNSQNEKENVLNTGACLNKTEVSQEPPNSPLNPSTQEEELKENISRVSIRNVYRSMTKKDDVPQGDYGCQEVKFVEEAKKLEPIVKVSECLRVSIPKEARTSDNLTQSPKEDEYVEVERIWAKQDHTPAPARGLGQKPRAAKKRWALNFANKTGSLKSLKSEGGHSFTSQESLEGSGTLNRQKGFGPMLLAAVNGLTKSRQDLSKETCPSFAKPSKLARGEIGAFLENKLTEGEVLKEFEQIPKRKTENVSYESALLAENVSRNRFNDVLPYERNRVKLVTNERENKTGYINASQISASIGQDQRFYIAAQGPMPNTVVHFWQMIFQCDVHLIVMLTETSSQMKTSQCMPYWPEKKGSILELGDFKILNKFTSQDEDLSPHSTTTLIVTHLPTNQSRTIWHLQYSDWSNHGCPSDSGKFIEFLEEMSALRNHIVGEIPIERNRNPPVLVHCSAGVGRTGVTILCDILLHCVDHNLEVDIPKVLTHLRQQRMLMVQTIAQYKFVHLVLIHYLKQSRLI